MKRIVFATVALTALFTAAASAAPISPLGIEAHSLSNVDQVRLVCNEYGRCFRTRGPRYVQRGYGEDGYVVRRSYGYYGSGPSYYGGGPGYGGYYGGGPAIGLSFGSRSW